MCPGRRFSVRPLASVLSSLLTIYVPLAERLSGLKRERWDYAMCSTVTKYSAVTLVRSPKWRLSVTGTDAAIWSEGFFHRTLASDLAS